MGIIAKNIIKKNEQVEVRSEPVLIGKWQNKTFVPDEEKKQEEPKQVVKKVESLPHLDYIEKKEGVLEKRFNTKSSYLMDMIGTNNNIV